jgi:predicted RNA-binding protein
MTTAKYWIAAVSQEHTMRGVASNFMQLCHGKQAPLKRMKKGDYLVVYSSKITMEGNEKCQAFTAIGKVKDDEVYQFQMTENFKPFRRNIAFLPCQESPIIPLINDLEFISNKKSWGYPFRFGFLEINKKDFDLISSKMLQNETIFANSIQPIHTNE